jgi:hypothetical protein
MPRRKDLFLWGAVLTSIALLAGDCASYNMTNPPRSATEQLLLSTSADRALTNADLTIFANQKVFLDTTYFDSYDSKYAMGAIRDTLSRAGALLAADAKSSDIIIEARSGADSIDNSSSLFGIPNMGVPIPLAGSLQIPELAFYKSQKQHAIAKFALLAYANQSRAHIYSSGSLDGKSFNFYHKIFFVSWTTTDIPENKTKPDATEKEEAWHKLYTPENMVFTNTPVATAPPTVLTSTNTLATNAPSAANAPSATNSTNGASGM